MKFKIVNGNWYMWFFLKIPGNLTESVYYENLQSRNVPLHFGHDVFNPVLLLYLQFMKRVLRYSPYIKEENGTSNTEPIDPK